MDFHTNLKEQLLQSLRVGSGESPSKSPLNLLKAFIDMVISPVYYILAVPIASIFHGDVQGYAGWGYTTSMMFYSVKAELVPLFASSAFAGALFGAVHCFAWYFAFPSHIELVMWKLASLSSVGSCVVMFVIIFFWGDGFDIDSNFLDTLLHLLAIPALAVLIALAFGSAFLYPVSRIFLLCLAVYSLRSLPPSAFDTVRWIELIPHI